MNQYVNQWISRWKNEAEKICPYAPIQQILSCSLSVLGIKGQVTNERWGGPGAGEAGILPWANVST